MPFRKVYRKRRAPVRRRPAYRRRAVAKKRVLGATAVTWIKKKLVSSVLPSGSPNAMTFTLTDIPDATSYAQLYDQYKITGVKVQIMPEQTVNTQGPAGSGNFVIPTLTYSYDSTDADTSWSETDLMQRENARSVLLNRPVSIFVRPKPNMVEAHGTQFLMPRYKTLWLSTHRGTKDIDTTSHYGLKYIVGNGGGSSQNSYFRVITTYYVSFKQGRTVAT